MDRPLLRIRGLTKSYGSVRALQGVDLDIGSGEIHGLLGENGAGKSTLLNVVSGLVVPDSGTVELEFGGLRFGLPLHCRKAGVRTVHQHFMLVPNFTVEENLALAELRGFGLVQGSRLAAPATDAASKLGWKLDLQERTGNLGVGSRQRVEIAKALAGEAKILVLDEPTAVLTADETAELFEVLRSLKSTGVSVLLIAHKLSEILAVTDRVTVLRHGRVTGTGETANFTAETLEELMVGKLSAQETVRPASEGKDVLKVSGLRVRGDRGEWAVTDLDLTVKEGEIFGIGGVDGNGQIELSEAVVGVRRPESGSVERPGTIAYIPQDRQSDGLALSMSVEDNLLLGRVPALVKTGPFISKQAVRQRAMELCEKFDVRLSIVGQPAQSLSGGNQQKVVVARELDKNPGLVVAINPTRGLDVAATAFVHSQLRQAAASGSGVLLVSTDADELAALSTRVGYLSHGRLVSRLGANA